jgi:aspartyl-tRNA(Asn)/glutamyl-tRNA(Gln) amidotransferase subunit C
VGQLSQVDTEGVEPMAHVLPVSDVVRSDVVESVSAAEHDGILANFPAREGDLLKVPSVFG